MPEQGGWLRSVVQGWEIETSLGELKAHLRGSKIVLRSKTPDLVKQEFYGLMMAHFAVRGLMHEAALKADVDPDRLSFLHAVRVVRRKIAHFVSIPPSGQEREYPKGIKVSDADLAAINIVRDDFYGEWNYTIHPR